MPRLVLITGCSSGIGQALAAAFAAHGDKVIATARRLESLDELQAAGCDCVALDVNDEASLKALPQALEASGHKKIDILINNAGISAMGPMLEIPADKLRAQFETNVIAPVLLSQILLPHLRASHRGIIVNIGSVSGILTTPFAGAYCASKAALHGISDAMRMELAPFGIQVVTVQPGAIQSSFGDAAAASINDWLQDDSLYAPIRDGIMARAGASQINATPAHEFAAKLLAGLECETPRPVQRIGHGSNALPLMQRALPNKLIQHSLGKKFRLTALRSNQQQMVSDE